MASWWIFAMAFLGLVVAGGYVATRRQTSMVRAWHELLTPAGRQALGSLELQVLADGASADHAYAGAVKARDRQEPEEALRLLGLAYQVVEEATPDRLKRLRGLAVCIRMASAIVPVKPIQARKFHIWQIATTVGLGSALHHLLLTRLERFVLRVQVLGVGFKIAMRVLAGATWSAYQKPEARAPWNTFQKALADWKTLDQEHLDTFRAMVVSLCAAPRE